MSAFRPHKHFTVILIPEPSEIAYAEKSTDPWHYGCGLFRRHSLIFRSVRRVKRRPFTAVSKEGHAPAVFFVGIFRQFVVMALKGIKRFLHAVKSQFVCPGMREISNGFLSEKRRIETPFASGGSACP